MLKHEKLPSTNSTKSGAHGNFAKTQENKHTPGKVNGATPPKIFLAEEFTDFSKCDLRINFQITSYYVESEDS